MLIVYMIAKLTKGKVRGMEKETKKKEYVSPKIEKIELEQENIILTSAGNGDVGRGRGRGGGCDGVPYHRTARTFSSGRNSGC